MRLPSLQLILNRTGSVARHYPFAFLAAWTAAFAAVWSIEIDAGWFGTPHRLLLSGLLGIPWTMAAETWGRFRFGAGNPARFYPGAVVSVLVVLACWTMDPIQTQFHRWALWLVAGLLAAAWLPVNFLKDDRRFWRYNEALFTHLLLTALYSGALFLGLVAALASMSALFDIPIKDIRYAQLWVVLATGFATTFFLGGVPARDDLEKTSDYPLAIKVFARYILLPVVILYSVILYAYMGKILLEWDLPRGWVSWLVIGYSIAGILSFLLAHPLLDDPEERWVGTVGKRLFQALIPLTVLMLVAIWVRIDAYGITENRYLVLATAVWLMVVIAGMIRYRNRNIRLIPGSLMVVALAISVGPWGLASVSERSQSARWEASMAELGLTPPLQAGALADLDDPLRYHLEDVSRYLVTTHGQATLRSWMGDSLAAAVAVHPPERSYRVLETLQRHWGLDRPGMNRLNHVIGLNPAAPAGIPVAGYATLRTLSLNRTDPDHAFPEGEAWSTIRYDFEANTFHVSGPAIEFELDMTDWLRTIKAGEPADAYRLAFPGGEVLVGSVLFRAGEDSTGVESWDLHLLTGTAPATTRADP